MHPAFAVYLGWVVISILVCRTRSGAMTYLFTMSAAVFAFFSSRYLDRTTTERFFFGLSLALLVYGFYQKLVLFPRLGELPRTAFLPGISDYAERGRVNGTYESPNILVLMAMLSAYPFLVKKRYGLPALISILIAGLFLTRSFSAVLAFLFLAGSFPMNRKRLLAAALTVAAITVILLLTRKADLRISDPHNPVVMRVKNFSTGMNIFFKSPIIGHGIGSFTDLHQKYKDPDSNDIRFAHNIVIQHLTDGGIVFLGCFIYLAVFLYLNTSPPGRAVLLAVIAHNMVEFSFYSSSVMVFLFFLCGAYGQKHLSFSDETVAPRQR